MSKRTSAAGSALRSVRDLIKDRNDHQLLDMLADPDNPRDLFGMIERYAKATEAK